MAVPLALTLTSATIGWITSSQLNDGARPKDIAEMFNDKGAQTRPEGIAQSTEYRSSLGYYWHQPEKVWDNRGLGGGIAWAFDDTMCNDGQTKRIGNGVFEDQFRENLFFTPFVTCISIRASLHRAFNTWTAAHPLIYFVDVTEECRRLYGAVFSNCSLVELFISHRDGNGLTTGKKSYTCTDTTESTTTPSSCTKTAVSWYSNQNFSKGGFSEGVVKHPYAWPNPMVPYEQTSTSKPYPGGGQVDGHPAGLTSLGNISVCNITGSAAGKEENGMYVAGPCLTNSGGEKIAGVVPFTPEMDVGGGAAAALQYLRYAKDLRSTNGKVQRYSDADFYAIEAYGGIMSFSTEKCWYLDTSFCGPLHSLKAKMGKDGASSMILGISFGIFSVAMVVLFVLLFKVGKHQHCCDEEGRKRTCKEKTRLSAKEMADFGVLPTTVLFVCLWVPIALQQTIVKPCWECYDFEAAAVQGIGHILGLNHPDHGNSTGSNAHTHSALTASNNGMRPYDSKGFPSDICQNPWKHVVDGAYNQSDDLNADTNVRESVMYTLTEHNPKVCLTSDDMEAIYTIYPLCNGRALPTSTARRGADILPNGTNLVVHNLNCYKPALLLGSVRVMVYILSPLLILLLLQLILAHALKEHHDEEMEELHEKRVTAVKRAKSQKKKAAQMEKALQEQSLQEQSRVEKRAEELAQAKIAAHIRGNVVRKQSNSSM
jgi:hypothetical protein